jgi:tRNA (guanine6-N2)-methyltransferase
MKGKPITYLAHTQPGFETLVAEQLRPLAGVTVRDTFTFSDKNGVVRFTATIDPNELLELRSFEDLFVQVLSLRDMPPVYAGLRALRDEIVRAPLEQALTLARTLDPSRGGQGRLRYRVVSRLAGQVSYRRIDAQDFLEKGINARADRRWQQVSEGGLEFWLNIMPHETVVALRLSDTKTRHRTEKREHLPASLRPAAAAALIELTRPRPTDVFLDPMCGAGTLLIERALAGRYKQLLGGDIRPEAVAATHANIGTRYQPITVQEWDARALPLDAESISVCAVNLPFGAQIGSPAENRTLYPAVLRELVRVLRPAGRLVALTGDPRAFEQALPRTGTLRLLQTYQVLVLGRRATVYQIEKG